MLHEDNSLDIDVECLSCNTRFQIKHKALRTDSRWAFDICPACGCQIKFCPTDFSRPVVYKQLLEDVTEKYFEMLASENKRIVVWGVKQRMQLLLMSSHNLRRCIVKLVDGSYLDYPDKLFGLYTIEDPAILKNTQFDYLLVGSTHYKDEIIREARSIVSTNFKILDL
jgi:hypothetical protein